MRMDQESCERKFEDIDWGAHVSKEQSLGKKPTAKYVAVSETLRHTIPEDKQCKMFCGGGKCKYESPDAWTEDQQAIKGLFSHWVTNNILAMARPNTKNIETYKILEQFKSNGIKSIINLQRPGEHSYCGGTLENNEFSYKQTDFMNNNVFFYNFGWRDYGVASLNTILDMVKVMQFAVSEGKVAVHCHAGLGRTGVLIACYLVFNNRMHADEAIHYVRSRRPNAIQTRGQILCVQDFGKYLEPLRIIYSSVADTMHSFTLGTFLTRQTKMLHGLESRSLKFLPKVLFILCERMLQLAGKHGHPEDTIKDNFALMKESVPHAFSNINSSPSLHSIKSEHEIRAPPQYTRKSASLTSFPGARLYDNRETDSGIESNEGEGVATVNGDNDSDLNSNIMGSMQSVLETADKRVISTVTSLLVEEYDADDVAQSIQYQKALNADESTWDGVRTEDNVNVLAAMLWSWLDELQEPVIRAQDMSILEDHVADPVLALDRLERGAKTTIEYLVKVILRFGKLPEHLEHSVVNRLITALTHQSIPEHELASLAGTQDNISVTSNSNMKRVMDSGVSTLTGYRVSMIFTFFYNLLEELTKKAVEKCAKKK